jgi:hypothetical protein
MNHCHTNHEIARMYVKKNPFLKTPYFYMAAEHCGPVVNTYASYLGGPRFVSWPGDRLSSLRFFMVFLCPSMRVLGEYLKLDFDQFLTNPLQFIIHLLSFHLMLHSLSY